MASLGKIEHLQDHRVNIERGLHFTCPSLLILLPFNCRQNKKGKKKKKKTSEISQCMIHESCSRDRLLDKGFFERIPISPIYTEKNKEHQRKMTIKTQYVCTSVLERERDYLLCSSLSFLLGKLATHCNSYIYII